MRVERVDSLEALHDDWSTLETAGSIFGTWEWADTWWRHYAPKAELLVHTCRDEHGCLVTVLPLYAWRRRLPRVVRFIGHGPGDELGPVHMPGCHARAAEGLRLALASLEWDIFLAEQLPGALPWTALLGGRQWRREASPVLRVPAGGWPEYLDSRTKNFKQQLRRRRTALTRAGKLCFRLADEGTLDRDLDTLFRLHSARWVGRQTDFSDTPFHREFARRAMALGWLRLWVLELDGRSIAAWYGFHVGDVVSYYQAGRDPSLDRLSLGFVLMAHTLQCAMEEGATDYRFGRGAEAFKYRFASADPSVTTVVLPRGLLGHATVTGAAVARRGRRLLRSA